MKIAFLNPPWWEMTQSGLRFGVRAGSRWPFTSFAHCLPDQYAPGGYLPFPHFLAYAASYAKHALPTASVVLRDSIALRESYQSFFDWLEKERPSHVVIESATPSWEHDKHTIGAIAALLPRCKIIVAGTITATKSADVLRVPGVVAAVQGEYEKGVQLAIAGHTGLIGHDLLTVQQMNLAAFPVIPFDTWDRYWDPRPFGTKGPQLQVWSSRGCPYRCCFCAWPATMTGNDPDGTGKRSVRLYSPEYMRSMIADACCCHAFASIYDDSDTFNLVDRHTRAMCEVYRETGLPWSAMCRADTSSHDTWTLMRDSGCFGVKLGFESGSQRVIDHIINKRLNLEEAAATAQFIRSLGMSVHGTFTIGLPGESPAEARQTVDFIQSLYRRGAIDSHQLSGTAVIEGTPLGNLAEQGLGGKLAAYDQAVVDGNFMASTDGQAKIEKMTR